MAESSKDIESGSHRLESPLLSAMETSLDKKLRNFAFILALIEKAGTTLGTMNFIWATVVLLGGFSQSLKSIDFWFVNVILLVEGLRILCRQGELKTAPMTWLSSSPDFMVQLIYQCSLLIQQYSAVACILLSSLRIHKQKYGSDHNMNRNRALNIFYWLSVVESCLTLFGFAVRLSLPNPPISEDDPIGFGRRLYYSFWTKFVLLVFGESLHPLLVRHAQRFFYDTYCRCMKGSAFDGLKMDFVSYSVELLQSTDDIEQLEGAKVLFVLVSEYYPSEKLGAIAATPRLLERLIELLSWEKPEKKEIRTEAGKIISKLLEIPANHIRVMAIPASMESIGTLLYDRKHTEYHQKNYQGQSYNYEDFTVMGKRILKSLGKDPYSGFEAEHSDDPNLPSVDSQV